MLKRVSIQNFKSLKDVTLDLQKVNLLIGPNNSGKTNFLKALEFVGNLDYSQNEIELNKVFKKNIDADLVLTFTFDNSSVNVEEKYSHYKVSPLYNGFQRKYSDRKYILAIGRADTGELKVLSKNIANAEPQTDIYRVQIDDINYDFGTLLVYKPDPNKITQPGPVGISAETVNADASNLVGFLDLMLGKYRRPVFNRTEEDLQTCISEFDEINLEDAPPTDELKKQFGDKSFKKIGLTNSKQGITYWADELSEGTLYFLALLCIINQPNPPKLLLLEEPEKGIHPRRIREVMDFIFRLAEEKDVQIILTTHNEHVLDDFATRPEAVFVFDKDEEGATYVRNLQKDIIEPTNQHNRELGLDEIDLTTNLSENWLYGLLGGVPSIP